jgi:hypothetical protein
MNAKLFIDRLNLSTRRKRRAAIDIAIILIEKIYRAEEQHQFNNFANEDVYSSAGYTMGELLEAILILSAAYR